MRPTTTAAILAATLGALSAPAAELPFPGHPSEVAFRLPERALIPESIAWDPADASFYVGSMYKRKIIKIDRSGRVSDFVRSKQDGLFGVLGMKVDTAARELWANSCNIDGRPPMIDPEPASVGSTAVHRYDLKTGKLIRKYPAGGPSNKVCFNDLAFAANGDVYLTSGDGGIYRIDRKTDSLEQFLKKPDTFFNGIAAAADGQSLYLASHAEGILRLDLGDRSLHAVPVSGERHMKGIDGLYVSGYSLVGVQNGTAKERIVQGFLSASGDAIDRVDTLDESHPLFRIPTTGVIVGDMLYYVATSQLASFDGPDIWPSERLSDTIILKIRLKPAPKPDRHAREKQELLEIHRQDREAHFKASPDLLMEHAGDDFVAVSAGDVSHPSKEDTRAMFTAYFKGASYTQWDDVIEPIIRVSDDGTMAWMIVKTRVRGSQKTAEGGETKREFVYAGVMMYEKQNGKWVRVGNVSTFEPQK